MPASDIRAECPTLHVLLCDTFGQSNLLKASGVRVSTDFSAPSASSLELPMSMYGVSAR